jgi:hypothetical protein
VPPACFRAFDPQAASSGLSANADARRLLESEAIVEDGKIHGVFIPWIEGLGFWPLEKEPLRSEVRAWLSAKSELPPAKAEMARQVSTLYAFDFVTTNWDRYSGENVGIDRSGKLVIYIDNDAAFMDGPPKDALAKNRALVEATDRFSKSFVEHLRALDEPAIAHAFGDELEGHPLYPPATVAATARRAKDLLTIIDAKIKARGESETLLFP